MLRLLRRFDVRPLVGAALVSAAIAFVLPQCSSNESQNSGSPDSGTNPLLETGLQGEVPRADQMSGRSKQGYIKNMKVIGHTDVNNRGGNGHLGWIDECAYFRGGKVGTPEAGLAVVDVKDPTKPTVVNIFAPPAGYSDFAVWADQTSRLLVTNHLSAANSLLRVYTVPADCTKPVLAGTYNFGNDNGQVITIHEHKVWHDKIFVGVLLKFATPTFDPNTGEAILTGPAPGPSLTVVDASDPTKPTLLTTWDMSDEPGQLKSGIHNLSISADGTRAYVAGYQLTPDGHGMSGLVILDTSEVANWKPGNPRPTIRRVSPFLAWHFPGASHTAELATIAGRKYVLAENEGGAGCPSGFAQIIDVNNVLGLFPLSSFRLEISDPRNCTQVLADIQGWAGLLALNSTHYLGVDNPDDAKLAAFTWYGSGLRIVDISNPETPKEVAYFNAPAVVPTYLVTGQTGQAPFFPDPAYSFVRYHNGNWWHVTIDGGFWVTQYTP